MPIECKMRWDTTPATYNIPNIFYSPSLVMSRKNTKIMLITPGERSLTTQPLRGRITPTRACYRNKNYADVVELVDSVDLGSSVFDVQVRVLSSAPIRKRRLSPPLFSVDSRKKSNEG